MKIETRRAVENLIREAYHVLADGQQYVPGVSFEKGPFGEYWDKRWKDDLDALEKSIEAAEKIMSAEENES